MLYKITCNCAIVLSAFALTFNPRVEAQTLQLTPGVDYSLGNYAYSPPIRKFVDKIPGLTAVNSNSLGQHIPIAVPNIPYGSPYPGSDYYEIGLVEYVEQLHQLHQQDQLHLQLLQHLDKE